MPRDNLGSKQTIELHNCLNKNERYNLVITPHRETIEYIRSKRQTRKKDNHNKTKTNYKRSIFKTKKRSLRIRHKYNAGPSRFKSFKK